MDADTVYAGIVVNRQETQNGIVCLIFCKKFPEPLTYFAAYNNKLIPNYGQVVNFVVKDNNVELQLMKEGTLADSYGNLSPTLKGVILLEETDPNSFPFTLYAEVGGYGKVLVPAGHLTKPGTTVTLNIVYNDMLVPGKYWYAVNVKDQKQQNASGVTIVGLHEPYSMRTYQFPYEIPIEPDPVCQEVKNVRSPNKFYDIPSESTNHLTRIAPRDEDSDFLKLYLSKHNNQENRYLNKLIPQYSSLTIRGEKKNLGAIFPICRYREKTLYTEAKVFVLLRCHDFAICIRYPYNTFGVVFHSDETFSMAMPGNVINCEISVPDRNDMENPSTFPEFYEFIGHKCTKFLATHNIHIVHRPLKAIEDGDIVALAAMITLLIFSDDLEGQENPKYFSFQFGYVIFDDDCVALARKYEDIGFYFKATLSIVKDKEEDHKATWYADSATFRVRPEHFKSN